MSDTTTTTAPSSNDLPPGISPPPAGGTTGGNNGPTYLGVGYQTNDTGMDLVVYEDGTAGPTNADGSAPTKTDKTGKTMRSVIIHPGQTVTDVNGTPLPYRAPVEQQLNLPASRVAAGDTTNLGTAVMFVPARYRTGDEVRELGAMSPELRAQVIQLMRAKGLVGATATPSDWWNGLRQVMSQANATGNDWMTELQRMPEVATTVKPNAYNITLHSPDDLKAIFQKAVHDYMGGGSVPDSEVQRFVDAYQAKELADQQHAVGVAEETANRQAGITQPTVAEAASPLSPAEGTQPAPPGGPIVNVTTATPSPEQFAAQMVRQRFGGEVNRYAMLGTYNTFMNLIANGIR